MTTKITFDFSPTPGISITRLMVFIASANDLELHSVDIYTKQWILILGTKDSTISGSKSRFDEDQLSENMMKTFLSRFMLMIVLLPVNLQV